MKKPKILFLGWEFPPVINGGLGIACYGMAKSLSKLAHVTVILPEIDPSYRLENIDFIGLSNVTKRELLEVEKTVDYSVFKEVEFVETEILPYQTREIKTTMTVEEVVEKRIRETEEVTVHPFEINELYGADLINKVVEYAKLVAQLVKDKEFDVIYAHDWMTFLAGLEVKSSSTKPLICHVHSLTYDRSGPHDRGWIYDLEKYALEKADAIVTVSDYTVEVIRDHLGINHPAIHTIHNGIEPVKSFRTAKGFPEKLVLFLGRITAQKGPEQFLEIAAQVLEKNQNCRFVMAGQGDQLKRVIESGAYRNLGHRFHVTGFLNRSRIHELLSMTDVYCMPSKSEPFGLSALEAAQFHIPAVISRQSGVGEVLTGALKNDYWDTEGFATNICQLLADDTLAQRVVESGVDDLKDLTWTCAAKELMAVIDNIID